MTTKILELSQNNADVVLKNGEYTISLPYSKDLIMTDGDTLTMKNIFIDTESQSNQKINIPKDISVKMEFGFYYNYTREDELVKIGSTGDLPTTDGKNWVVCYDTHRNSPSDMDELYEIHVQGNYNNPVEGGWVDVKYHDEADAEQTTRITIPASPNRQEPSSHALCSIYYKKTFTPVLTPEKGLTGAITIKTKTTTGNNPHLTPVLRQFELTIKQGSYTPDQIVIEFNRQVQKAVLGGDLNAIYSNDFLIDRAKMDTATIGIIYLCKEDGTKAMKLSGTNKLLFGASFVELEFQSDTNQFSFQYLHTPYYTDPTDTVPSQPAVGFLNLTDPVGANYISVNKNSGIFFKTLSSEYPDGTDATFWDKILGFNLNTLIPQIQSVATQTIGTIPFVLMKFNSPLEDGINITGGFFPLSAQVNLTNLPTGNKWYQAVNMATTANFLSTTSDTFNILGGQSTISNTQYNSGFFLVGINANFNTSFYSKDNQDNIMAIVSRFYSLNSFTSGTQDDSLIYTHRGDPLTLSSFQVRIMNDKKTIAENLGENSVIFLQISSNN